MVSFGRGYHSYNMETAQANQNPPLPRPKPAVYWWWGGSHQDKLNKIREKEKNVFVGNMYDLMRYEGQEVLVLSYVNTVDSYIIKLINRDTDVPTTLGLIPFAVKTIYICSSYSPYSVDYDDGMDKDAFIKGLKGVRMFYSSKQPDWDLHWVWGEEEQKVKLKKVKDMVPDSWVLGDDGYKDENVVIINYDTFTTPFQLEALIDSALKVRNPIPRKVYVVSFFSLADVWDRVYSIWGADIGKLVVNLVEIKRLEEE